jgi:uncharacterized protein (DUF1697 family)
LTRYVSFLRGINVGGKTVKMDKLKSVFESLGFTDVKTLLASGNVIFLSEETDAKILNKKIEAALHEAWGFDISVTNRTIKYIQELIESNPFKTITDDAGIRLYVTFLKEDNRSNLVIPYESPKKDYRIVSATGDEVFMIVEADGKTTDAMDFLDKKFGKKVTTRNWNTVVKISML